MPPQWGRGRLFGASAVFFFLGNEKSKRCHIDHLAEGYKRAIDKIWGPTAKNGFLGRYPIFWLKKRSLLDGNHVLATARQSCAREKVPLTQINVSL